MKHWYLLWLSISAATSITGNELLPPSSFYGVSEDYRALAEYFEKVNNKEKAKEVYQKALTIDPANVHARLRLGHLFYEENDIPTAITHFRAALPYSPHNAALHFNLGRCYIKQQNWNAAYTALKNTIRCDPHYTMAYVHYGSVCEHLTFFEDACASYKQAIALDPQCFEAYYALGNALKNKDFLHEALDHYQTAHRLQPDNLTVMMELANTLNMLDHNQESLELYKKIIEKKPSMLSALYNFGFTLKKMGFFDHAIEIYQKVLKYQPQYAPAHFSLALIYLTRGELERGWHEYEWRWKAYNEEPKKTDSPLWNGQNLSHRSLTIYAEQGLGDTLQFIRYLKILKETYQNIQLIFVSQEPLIPLLAQQPYIDHVVSRRDPLPPCDYHVSLMSLPYLLKTRLSTIPASIPYITPSPSLVEQWKTYFANDKNFKIGICWQGNAQYSTPALRRAVALKSITLEQLAPLFDIPGVSLYSLQKINGHDQIDTCPFKDKLITFDASFDHDHGRFMDTAAVMCHLDLIITIDTSIAHLAGSIGTTPVWVLLPEPADWRWMLHRSDSPWYPSVRLFRQHKPAQWDTVITHVAQELSRLVATSTQTASEYLLQQPSSCQQIFFENLVNALEEQKV